MQVSELMTKDVQCCQAEDVLSRAAQIMWERDCGIVPVLDAEARVVAMITDRDICMATYTKNLSPSAIRVIDVASRTVYAVGADDTVEDAERIMQEQQLRRLPVLDEAGHIVGLLSLNDLANHATGRHGLRKKELTCSAIEQTLASIGAPRTAPKAPAKRANGNAAARA
jgi:CBS domain-containing protein